MGELGERRLGRRGRDAGDEVVFAWRSFEAYPILVRLAGATPVMVALNDAGEHDLDAMAAAVTDRTKLVILCTPNNPTGPIITDAAVRAFLAKVPAEVVVIIDEVADVSVLPTTFPSTADGARRAS